MSGFTYSYNEISNTFHEQLNVSAVPLCAKQAQGRRRRIALPILDARSAWVVNATPGPLYTRCPLYTIGTGGGLL
jgi:hypothetical protein